MPSSGAAYVFARAGTAWSQQAYLKAGNTDAGDYFGISVSIDGDSLVVGAYGEASCATGVDGDGSNNGCTQAGAAYVFTRTGGAWSQQAYLKAPNAGSGDEFGIVVAISGDTIVIGAHNESSNQTTITTTKTASKPTPSADNPASTPATGNECCCAGGFGRDTTSSCQARCDHSSTHADNVARKMMGTPKDAHHVELPLTC